MRQIFLPGMGNPQGSLGRPSLVPLPGFAMRLTLGEVSSVALEGQHVVPKNLQDMGFEFRFPDAESALRNLLE